MKLPEINLRKLKGFLFQHRISVAIVFVAIVAACGATWYGLSRNISVDLGPLKLKEKVETRVPAPLTGELVDSSVITKRPIAVVIENHPDARPQSGYNDADLVYETLAEGGITRTLAIFQSKSSNEIGPVRSARSYFVDWLTAYGALFGHVGGNADALDLVSQIGVADLNQFYNGGNYWRSSDRYAPHNVYTTTDKLYAAAKANNLSTTATVGSLKFKKDLVEKDRPATQNVSIEFSYGDFTAGYTYVPKTNTYSRSIAGEAAKDKNTGIQIAPKNVIVEFTPITPYVNYAGEQGVRITDIGSGSGYLFQDGKSVKITWSKSSREARTKYTDESGKEIELNPGQTWIEVVPTGNSVTF